MSKVQALLNISRYVENPSFRTKMNGAADNLTKSVPADPNGYITGSNQNLIMSLKIVAHLKTIVLH